LVGEAVGELSAELGQLVAAPGVRGLAGNAIALRIVYPTDAADGGSAKAVESVFTLVQGER